MPKQRSRKPKSHDAVAMLIADHDKVKKLFKRFEKLHERDAGEEQESLAKQICNELTVHVTVEEEIFYPAVREAIDDDDLLDEAEVEHATAKDLISQIESMGPADDKFAAKVCVLGEYINHHVEEEQSEMFPKARKAKLDLAALGEQIMERKRQLQSELGMEPEDETESAGKRQPHGMRAGRSGRAQQARR